MRTILEELLLYLGAIEAMTFLESGGDIMASEPGTEPEEDEQMRGVSAPPATDAGTGGMMSVMPFRKRRRRRQVDQRARLRLELCMMDLLQKVMNKFFISYQGFKYQGRVIGREANAQKGIRECQSEPRDQGCQRHSRQAQGAEG